MVKLNKVKVRASRVEKFFLVIVLDFVFFFNKNQTPNVFSFKFRLKFCNTILRNVLFATNMLLTFVFLCFLNLFPSIWLITIPNLSLKHYEPWVRGLDEFKRQELNEYCQNTTGGLRFVVFLLF